MKILLAAICSFTVLATGYLSLSILILHPPRADYLEWLLMAALFMAQGALTLASVAGAVSGGLIRWLLVSGSVAVVLAGAVWVRVTMSGGHFEGYALVLGSLLIVQGVLTLCVFWRKRTLGLVL